MIASFLNYMFGYNKQTDICNKTNMNMNTNNIDKLCKKLPYELKDYILSYDGRIKYKYKIKNSIDYHKFVNVIHKHDERYNIITPIIGKKQKIMKETEISSNKSGFEFVVSFNKHPCMLLCYENNKSVTNKFVISYINMKEARAIISSDIIRTIYN
jgi:ABC-type bacteriocin/lantibiotic exporter with double-glycine peptidase domain